MTIKNNPIKSGSPDRIRTCITPKSRAYGV